MNRHGPSRKKLLRIDLRTQGGRIRFERIAAGLTMTELADRMSAWGSTYTKSFISLLEVDRTQPSVVTLRDIGRALNVSLDWLVYGEERPHVTRSRKRSELVAAMRTYQAHPVRRHGKERMDATSTPT